MDLTSIEAAARRVVARIREASLPHFSRPSDPKKGYRRCGKCGMLTQQDGPVCLNAGCGGEVRGYLSRT